MLTSKQIKIIRSIFPKKISSEFMQVLIENARIFTSKKNDILVEEKAQSSKIFYILKGSMVRYVLTEKGDRRAIMFHSEDLIPIVGSIYINSHNSFVQYQIVANESTEVLEINILDILKSGLKDEVYFEFALKGSLKSFGLMNQIQNHQIGLSKIEFLKWLWLNYPDIFHRFKSQDIASFLGLTPVWYSNLKATLLRDK